MENNDLKPNDLTQADINQIAFEILEQTADPEDARRLLQMFCDLYELWGGDSFETDQVRQFEILLRHLHDSFQSYLNGERKTLEAALGLKRKRARPKADPQIRTGMAAELLRLRLKNSSYLEAVMEVAEMYDFGETIVREAWAAHKQDALILLRLERAIGSFPWTPEEIKRLTEIFGKELWFIGPEKSANKPD